MTLHRDDFGRIGLHRESRRSQIPFPVDGREIILVDDVLHSGRTIRAALNELFDFGRPKAVRRDHGRARRARAADLARLAQGEIRRPDEDLVRSNESGRLRLDMETRPRTTTCRSGPTETCATC